MAHKDNITNLNFLKETIFKFKNEIHKMISNTNYASSDVIQLKKTVEEIETDINHREKLMISSYLSRSQLGIKHNKKKSFDTLPLINQSNGRLIKSTSVEENIYKTLRYKKLSSRNRSMSHRQINREFEIEKAIHKQNIIKRHLKGELEQRKEERMKSFEQKKEINRLLSKYDINCTLFDRLKIPCMIPNYMSKEKMKHYSTINKQYNYHCNRYNEMNQPIITQKNMTKGLLNMIHRGLIPKDADVTPAFESNGHPMQINIMRSSIKVNNDNAVVIENNFNQDQKQERENGIKQNNRSNTYDFFITKPYERIRFDNSNRDENKVFNNNKTIKDNDNDKLFSSDLDKLMQRKTLVFFNYCIYKNNDYFNFNKEHLEKWGAFAYLFIHVGKFLQLLHLNFAELYQDKLIELAYDEMKPIEAKDILSCIVELYLKKKHLNSHSIDQYDNRKKDYSAKMIQTSCRSFLAKIKLRRIKDYLRKVLKIQNTFKSSSLMIEAKKKAKALYEKRYQEWNKMMDIFKVRWEIIKSLPHVEIHLNSISTHTSNDCYLNSTRQCFSERENNQINRIACLNDPNVEMVYISPYEISNDILAYYSSILDTMGVNKVKERFHILVPSATKCYSQYFPLSQLLLLSPDTIRAIKRIIGKKEAFIVPGNGEKNEIELSMLLDIPILMGDLYQTESIFTKSGVKLLFEGNDVKVPYSVWDIKSEEEFYQSLSHLIVSYPYINIWIFKINFETNGRGISYIQLNKMPQYIELLKRRSTLTENQLDLKRKTFQNDIEYLLKVNLSQKVIIVTNQVYKSWDEYLSTYIKHQGVIEACPTNNLNNILGSPCISLLIEPTGKIECVQTYDKITCGFFRGIAAISPQKTYHNTNELNNIANKIGVYLYKHNIIGYITIEFIVFNHNNTNNSQYWAIDVKFGLNDMLSLINFGYFLYSKSINLIHFTEFNFDSDNEKALLSKCTVFAMPFFSHSKIKEMNITNLFKSFRNEKLLYDIETRKGVVFNFSNRLKCGSMGLCGIVYNNKEPISNEEKASTAEIWKIINTSCGIIASLFRIKEDQSNIFLDQRIDTIEICDIISKINKMAIKAELNVVKCKKI